MITVRSVQREKLKNAPNINTKPKPITVIKRKGNGNKWNTLWLPGLQISPRSPVPKRCLKTLELYKSCILLSTLRACLHGGGGLQVGEVTRLAVVEK